ncbi:hypothetical protein Nmel_005556 [Mimus melanotis]
MAAAVGMFEHCPWQRRTRTQRLENFRQGQVKQKKAMWKH